VTNKSHINRRTALHDKSTKLVIVGVADSIDQLSGDHESVQRAVEEVPMPRMTESETFDVIDGGLARADVTTSNDARIRIASLSEGLPHYTHLLALGAGQRAIMDDRSELNQGGVEAAVAQAGKKHSLSRGYQTAVQSPRGDNRSAACWLRVPWSDKNRLGYFTPGSVVEPMSRIMGKPYEIASFSTHLNALTEIECGGVLRQGGFVPQGHLPLPQPAPSAVRDSAALAAGEISDDYVASMFAADEGCLGPCQTTSALRPTTSSTASATSRRSWSRSR
jgi:hypothetical protein